MPEETPAAPAAPETPAEPDVHQQLAEMMDEQPDKFDSYKGRNAPSFRQVMEAATPELRQVMKSLRGGLDKKAAALTATEQKLKAAELRLLELERQHTDLVSPNFKKELGAKAANKADPDAAAVAARIDAALEPVRKRYEDSVLAQQVDKFFVENPQLNEPAFQAEVLALMNENKRLMLPEAMELVGARRLKAEMAELKLKQDADAKARQKTIGRTGGGGTRGGVSPIPKDASAVEVFRALKARSDR